MLLIHPNSIQPFQQDFMWTYIREKWWNLVGEITFDTWWKPSKLHSSICIWLKARTEKNWVNSSVWKYLLHLYKLVTGEFLSHLNGSVHRSSLLLTLSFVTEETDLVCQCFIHTKRQKRRRRKNSKSRKPDLSLLISDELFLLKHICQVRKNPADSLPVHEKRRKMSAIALSGRAEEAKTDKKVLIAAKVAGTKEIQSCRALKL